MRTSRVLILIAALLVLANYAKADIFSKQAKLPIGKKNPAAEVVKIKEKIDATKKRNDLAKKKALENVIRTKVEIYKNDHPEYFEDATKCECLSCDPNKVIFYFPIDDFTSDDLKHALSLAKEYHITPVLNIVTDRELKTKKEYIAEFERVRNKIPFGIVNSLSLIYDKDAIKGFKKYHGAWFKFDSVYGLRMEGKIDEFRKIYRTAFGYGK